MLFYSRQQNDFTHSDAPAWVADWLSKRTEKEEKKTTREEKPLDEAAQAKRRQARQQKWMDGLDELDYGYKDIVRNGILNIPIKDSSYFENMAKRNGG
jgi:hypothetical protein